MTADTKIRNLHQNSVYPKIFFTASSSSLGDKENNTKIFNNQDSEKSKQF